MIFLKRKRLIFWLLRAYIKRWGKIIFASFFIGFAIILLIFLNRNFIASIAPSMNSEVVGIAGDLPADDFPNNLPEEILNKTSRGLTKISPTGEVLPDLAKKWEVKDDGKTFVFYLNDNLYFSDGKVLDSTSINYNFSDVVVERPGKTVIIFKLKDKYSPFLVTVANRKIFNKNLVGVSDFKIKDVNTENGFVNNFVLESKKDKKKIKYHFYPSQAALKDAYVLGDVSKVEEIINLVYSDKVNLDQFKNTKITKVINSDKIATIFINTNDPVLSDKKVRKALAYSLPENFKEGERTYTPYKSNFWANKKDERFKRDLDYAKEQIEDSNASDSAGLKIELKVLRPYRYVAEEVSKGWKDLGIETKIVIVDGLPQDYQAFLGELPVLKDPDQYTLWHTGQPSNITNYRNLRIDKLLEDGRRTYDIEERKQIYSDFQKYLIDDMPAIFLYFPFTYTLTRN